MTAPAPDFHPPLPDEPEPGQAAPARPVAEVVSDDEEDEAPRVDKGKARQGEEDDDEVWDPSATNGREVEGRKVEEKVTTVTGTETPPPPTTTDTGGWQAVWAPAQNGTFSAFRSRLGTDMTGLA